MTYVRSLVSIVVVGFAMAACSAAPGEGSASSDEAMKGCGIDCGGGDNNPPPTPSSGSTCPGVGSVVDAWQEGWGSDTSWEWTLISQNCQAPIHWTNASVDEYLSLCPNTAAVANWVAQTPGAEEVYACDAYIPRALRGSIWVRLGAPFKSDCAGNWGPPKSTGGANGCSPSCPSGCEAW